MSSSLKWHAKCSFPQVFMKIDRWWIEVWFSFSWCCWGCRYTSWYLRDLFIAHWLVDSLQLFPYAIFSIPALFSHQSPESNQHNVIPFTHMASLWAHCRLYLFLPFSSLNHLMGCVASVTFLVYKDAWSKTHSGLVVLLSEVTLWPCSKHNASGEDSSWEFVA